MNTTKQLIEQLEKLSNKKVVLKEGISANSFEIQLAAAMQKYLPKDRWTVTYERGEIIVKNDFDETASFRMETFESNEGHFRRPNFPEKGSAEK